MTPPPSPVRVAAVRAAAMELAQRQGFYWDLMPSFSDAFCVGDNHQDMLIDARAALIAYARAMGRTVEAEQLERMRDE